MTRVFVINAPTCSGCGMVRNACSCAADRAISQQASTLRGQFPERVPASQADVLGREPDEDEDLDDDLEDDDDGEPVSKTKTRNEGDSTMNHDATRPLHRFADPESISPAERQIMARNAGLPVEATATENAQQGGNRIDALLLPATPVATLARERRAVLNAGTDGNQSGRRGQKATSKQASCLRDTDDAPVNPDSDPDADDDTQPDDGSTFSPLGDGSSASQYEDYVRPMHTPSSFLDTFVNSVTPDENGEVNREGMILPDSDPLSLNARRADLRAKGIDC